MYHHLKYVNLDDGTFIYSGDSSTMDCCKEGKGLKSLEELQMLRIFFLVISNYSLGVV